MKQLYILIFYTLRAIISKNGIRINPEINAYYFISLIQAINLVSIFNFLKPILDPIKKFEPTFISFIIIFFLPPFMFNYFFFIKSNRFEMLKKEIIYISISPKWVLVIISFYIVFTILFSGLSLLVNV